MTDSTTMNCAASSGPRALPIPLGARLGSLFGCTAWAFVLGVVVAAAGEPLLGLELGATGVALGLGLGQLTLLAIEAVPPSQRLLRLWGGLLVTTGVLLATWAGVMVPRLEEHPELWEEVRRLGGGAELPVRGCFLLIAAGAGLLLVPRRG